MRRPQAWLWPLLTTPILAIPTTTTQNATTSSCRQTQVLILGAGVAGITAAQALSNASMTDFIILERNDYIGGRMAHTVLGNTNITIELGANWIQGLGASDKNAPENPIWTFAKKWGVANTYSDYDSMLTYDETGYADYTDLLDAYDDAAGIMEADAGRMLLENAQDTSARAGLSLAGWKVRSMRQAAVEWWNWDWDGGYSPDESSLVFGVTGDNATFNQFGEDNNFVVDRRGFNTWLVGEASTFLDIAPPPPPPNTTLVVSDTTNTMSSNNDSRLLLNTTVTNITYSSTSVTAHTSDGQCFTARYAICTFSLGVLQRGDDLVAFSPPLPRWKREAIEQFQMGTYTKIFYQFPTTFWPNTTQYFLYADPSRRGYYPVWQSLSLPGFLPGSNIIFATVVDDEARRVERQSDAATRAEGLAVLRAMFPDVEVPEPVAFLYPRWTDEAWTHGSYSNWPVGHTLEKHENIRASVGALFFAGEHTSAEYYGFLHGSWFEGREAGERIAGALRNNGSAGEKVVGYEGLKGTTEASEYSGVNGWWVSSLLDNN